MEFRILGPLEVLENGQALDLGGQKQRIVLAVLLLGPNRVVSQQRLIDALWEEEPPETAVKALQVYVSQLRKAVGKERVVTRAPGYLLRVEPDELDVERFQRLAEEGKLAEALSLWRGAALSDFAYLRFAQSETARLEELRLACLEGRIEDDLARGRHAELTGELEALVREYPLRERLRAQLMLALYRSGRQAEALAAYQRARTALVEELGIEPSQDLRAVHQAILRQDPALKLAPAPAALVEGGPAAGPFVGRERELAELSQAHDDAIAGSGRLVLLEGEPGIGKTRLMDELARRARRAGVRVLWGRCWEEGGAPAYWPWVQAIRGYVRESEPDRLRAELGSGAGDLAQMLPELRELLPELAPKPPAEDEGARFRLFEAVAGLLHEASRTHPLLLVFDDVHAADEPSLVLLRFVGRHLGDSRILIVSAYRNIDPAPSHALASTVAELVREPAVQRLSLRGLAAGAVADFIREYAGVVPGPGLAVAIHAEADGNPLFVQEVVRLLAAKGKLEEPLVEGQLAIPQGVRDMIDGQLRGLSDKCRSLLELAAVLGRDFGLVALERAAGRPIDELLAHLDEATRARLVTELPGSLGRLHFAHALVRDVLYDELSAPRRMLLHKQAAEGLEQLYAGDPEPHVAELAHHFVEATPAGVADKALDYARRAAERAARLLAFEEAIRLYRHALDTLELTGAGEPEIRGGLLLALGDVQTRAGDSPSAKETFVAAADLAREVDDGDLLARAALGYGGRMVVQSAAGDKQLVSFLEEAVAAIGEGDGSLRARLLARLAGALRDRPDREPRAALSAEALAISRRLRNSATLAYALDGRLGAIWWPGNHEERLELAAELVALAQQTGDKEREFFGRGHRIYVLLELGEVAEAYREIETRARIAEQLRQPAELWLVAANRGLQSLLAGRFDEAEERIPRLLELGERVQQRDAANAARHQLLVLQREQGRQGELEETVGDAAPSWLRTVIDFELGREAEASAGLESLAAADFEDVPPELEWLFIMSLLSEVCALLGDGRAEKLYGELAPYAGLAVVSPPEVCLGSVDRQLGALAFALGRGADAERHFQQALELNERMGARPWLAHTQEDYGRMLLARGDEERGQKLLEQALSTYRELGMKGALARATAPVAK